MKPDRKHQLKEIFWNYIKVNLSAILLIPFLRLLQFYLISHYHTAPEGLKWMELSGMIQDIAVWILIWLVLLIPYILIAIINKRAGIIFISGILILFITCEILLFYYFLLALNLLDHIIFSYTFSELKMIVVSSGNLTLGNLSPVIIGVIVVIAGIWLVQKMKIKNRKYLILPVVLLSFIFLIVNSINSFRYNGSYEDSIRQNKTAYFIYRSIEYKIKSGKNSNDAEILEAAERFHKNYRRKEFSGPMYPFLHTNMASDVLAPFFTLGREKPNLVFIIVESLSSCYMGKDSFCGSYTPFLDSLAEKSLFWPNFLSSCERTFNVLPAVFASFPPLNHNLIQQTSYPQHLSLIRLLKENDYHTSFYYGGWTGFDNMREFLDLQGTDYYISSFGKYQDKLAGKNYEWGYHDDEVYSRSLEIIDSASWKPRLDIYLTLSNHEPFLPPDREIYLKMAKEKVSANGKRKMPQKFIMRHINIFATILYMDKALGDFLKKYEKRADYKNTIFIITGDHGMTELNMRQYSEIEKFHVPLIIYSPMLKKPRLMPAVSSHLDITPSLLALLRNAYDIEDRKFCAWMGDGLDTALFFRSEKIIPFIGGNRDITDYLDKNKFLYQRNLFDLYPGLFLKKIKQKGVEEKMTQDCNDLSVLSSYVVRNDKLIPNSVYAGRYIKSFEIPVPDTSFFNPADSISKYKDLVKDLRVSGEIKHFEVKISMELLKNQHDLKYPKVIFDLCDTNGKSLSWNALNITRKGIYGKWTPCRITGDIDVSKVPPGQKDYKIKIYIWNNEGSYSMFRNPKIEITGFAE